jgi:hypothetical protein
MMFDMGIDSSFGCDAIIFIQKFVFCKRFKRFEYAKNSPFGFTWKYQILTYIQVMLENLSRILINVN